MVDVQDGYQDFSTQGCRKGHGIAVFTSGGDSQGMNAVSLFYFLLIHHEVAEFFYISLI